MPPLLVGSIDDEHAGIDVRRAGVGIRAAERQHGGGVIQGERFAAAYDISRDVLATGLVKLTLPLIVPVPARDPPVTASPPLAVRFAPPPIVNGPNWR